MDSSSSSVSVGSCSIAAQTRTNELAMDQSGMNQPEPVDLLAQGMPVYVQVDAKTMLAITMKSLGATNAPLWTEIELGGNRFKSSVRLDVSGLQPSVNGQNLPFTTVAGESSSDRSTADRSAALKALRRLQTHHAVKIFDFSSQLCQRLDSAKTYDMVICGMRSLANIFDKWDLSFGKFQSLVATLEKNQFVGNSVGSQSASTKIYAVASVDLTPLLDDLHLNSASYKQKFKDLEVEIGNHENRAALKAQTLLREENYQKVVLPSQFIFDYLLDFFGLDDAIYRSGPKGGLLVHSSVKFEFPYFDRYKYGGNLKVLGEGSNSAEANEHAAFKALMFIENNFPVKIVDFNYSKREEALQEQNSLVSMLEKTIEIAEQVKKMWCQLNFEIGAQHALFLVDPSSLFPGSDALGQTSAYKICAGALEEAGNYSSRGLDACASDFELMMKLTWDLMNLRSNLDN